MVAAPGSAERENARQRELPPSLWARLRADPARAPEYVALAAAERHAPAAAAWVEERQRVYAHSPAQLAQMAKRRHASLARFGGAATGIGGVVTAIPDLAAAAWIQSRMVFFIAAAYGYDPYDPMRPAELLVIRGLYPAPPAARPPRGARRACGPPRPSPPPRRPPAARSTASARWSSRPTWARRSSATRRSPCGWRASSAAGSRAG